MAGVATYHCLLVPDDVEQRSEVLIGGEDREDERAGDDAEGGKVGAGPGFVLRRDGTAGGARAAAQTPHLEQENGSSSPL